ncbi:glycerol kinase GlpK [Sphingobacterium sp. SG20118]|uniref:glycerol kinase GlpK n=1 Tax=Sphingobacterium TaxID=28453 RepID=UPI0004F68571|nr:MULTISPECIES: glycerol kinase GlpK [Sphingobacterium]AIM37733.1 glycerol kinase [Sphingobacterium sp. ML3W]MDH5826142.1 glycerol kinase GlpK [Sphingobacterium faecium]
MSTKEYILALDQGTTSSRAIIFSKSGKIEAIAQKEFKQIYPHSGWVEHDPKEIWASQLSVFTEVMAKLKITPKHIKGIGITNQRETTIIWDRNTGEPVYNAIVWQDRRTANYCKNLEKEGYSDTIQQKTGLRIDSYFSASKINWILEHVEGVRERANRGELAFGTVDTWIIWNLTDGKVHVTDVSNASRTMLYNIETLNWDEELLNLFDIPKSLLPQVASSSEVYGYTSGQILSSVVPIAGIAGDQQAALFGQMCTKKGMAKNTYGTGCFLLMNIGSKPIFSKNNLVTTIAWKIGDKVTYALEGSVFIGGAVIQWLRDELGIIKTAAEVERLATSVKDSDGVYLVPAFSGLGAPHWNPYARGSLLGLSRGTNVAHIARAALEGIAFQVTDVLTAMQSDSQIEVKELRVDGGASANNFLMQTQANFINATTVRPEVIETTALGAAYLAGLAVGFWPSIEEIAEQWQLDTIFKPIGDDRVKQSLREWKRAVETTKFWANYDMND